MAASDLNNNFSQTRYRGTGIAKIQTDDEMLLHPTHRESADGPALGRNHGEANNPSEIAVAGHKNCIDGQCGCSHPQVILVEGQAPARAMAQMTTLSSAPMDESHDPICGSARMRALIALVSRR